MALGHLWAGRIFGTNTGNVFVKLEGGDTALVGTLHINEPGVGIAVYNITGSFDGTRVAFAGEALTVAGGMVLGQFKATAVLDQKGNLSGSWETTIGTAGTVILYPHDQSHLMNVTENSPDQLHAARHELGAVQIEREQLTALADDIQKEFSNGKVVVTVSVGGIEQSRFLEDFKTINFNSNRAAIAKIFVQEQGSMGGNKLVTIEFGPQFNYAMTQAPDEAWTLGKLEKLKAQLRPFERYYATNFKRHGFGINQVLLIGAITFLPSLANLQDRAILMAGVLILIYGVNRFHNYYLPFAAIYLGKKPESLLSRLAPSALSWLVSVTASVVAALLGAYLKGLLKLPSFVP